MKFEIYNVFELSTLGRILGVTGGTNKLRTYGIYVQIVSRVQLTVSLGISPVDPCNGRHARAV